MALLHVRYESEALLMELGMDVIIPSKSQYPTEQPREEYPVLYLLHGMGQGETSWQRYTRIERYVKDLDVVVVMPTGHRSFYTNTLAGNKYFDMMTKELPAVCRSMFPIKAGRENSFVCGLSMGGYGALKLGILSPETYSHAASLSGVVALPEKNHMNNPDKRRELLHYFGENLFDTEHDLLHMAQKQLDRGVDLPKLYMACGTEDSLYWTSQLFMSRFAGKLDITYREGPGAHTWDFWDEYVQYVLEWLPIKGNSNKKK